MGFNYLEQFFEPQSLVLVDFEPQAFSVLLFILLAFADDVFVSVFLECLINYLLFLFYTIIICNIRQFIQEFLRKMLRFKHLQNIEKILKKLFKNQRFCTEFYCKNQTAIV